MYSLYWVLIIVNGWAINRLNIKGSFLITECSLVGIKAEIYSCEHLCSKGPFHNLCDVIIMSRMVFSDLVDNDNQ